MSIGDQITIGLLDREKLGRAAHAVWRDVAQENDLRTPTSILSWDETPEITREAYRRIGETLFRLGRASALVPTRHKRMCADCGQQIGKRHKWHIGRDSKIRHRDCAHPIQPFNPETAAA